MKTVRLVGLLFMALTLSGCGFEIVDTGYRGVKTYFGEVIGEPLPEGIYFYNPITSNIAELDIREQRWSPITDAYNRDIQSVKV